MEAAFPLADGWTWSIGRTLPSDHKADPLYQHLPYFASASGHDGSRYVSRKKMGATPEEAVRAVTA